MCSTLHLEDIRVCLIFMFKSLSSTSSWGWRLRLLGNRERARENERRLIHECSSPSFRALHLLHLLQLILKDGLVAAAPVCVCVWMIGRRCHVLPVTWFLQSGIPAIWVALSTRLLQSLCSMTSALEFPPLSRLSRSAAALCAWLVLLKAFCECVCVCFTADGKLLNPEPSAQTAPPPHTHTGLMYFWTNARMPHFSHSCHYCVRITYCHAPQYVVCKLQYVNVLLAEILDDLHFPNVQYTALDTLYPTMQCTMHSSISSIMNEHEVMSSLISSFFTKHLVGLWTDETFVQNLFINFFFFFFFAAVELNKWIMHSIIFIKSASTYCHNFHLIHFPYFYIISA